MTLIHALSFGLLMTLNTHNVLDLSHIHVNKMDNYAYTHAPIEVEKDSIYTLILDADVIGQYYDYMDREYIEFDGAIEDIYFFTYDAFNDSFYVTFETTSSSLHIHYMPWHPHGDLNVSMYQGTIEDFRGFTVYQEPLVYEYVYVNAKSETLNIHAPWSLVYEDIDVKTYQHKGHEIYVNVYEVLIDSDPVTLDGPDEMYIYSNQDPYTHEDLRSYYASNGEVTIEFDTYEQTLDAGRYQVIIKATHKNGDVIRKYVYIHVIEVPNETIMLDDYFIEKSVFDVMTEADIYAYINTYLLDLNIAGDIYIKNNPYQMSIYDKTYDISYEVVSNEDTYEGTLMIHVTSIVKEEDTLTYVWILASTLSVGGLFLWIYMKKKHLKNR